MEPEQHGDGSQQGLPTEPHRLHLVLLWDCSQPSSCLTQHLQVCLTSFVTFCVWLAWEWQRLSSREGREELGNGIFLVWLYNPRISAWTLGWELLVAGCV